MSKLPEHWIPLSFAGLDAAWLPAIQGYAEQYARTTVIQELEDLQAKMRQINEQTSASYAPVAVASSAQIDYDPTPWCHACGAMTESRCRCGPIAENN